MKKKKKKRPFKHSLYMFFLPFYLQIKNGTHQDKVQKQKIFGATL